MNTMTSPLVTNSDFHIASPLPGHRAEVRPDLRRAVHDRARVGRDVVRRVGGVGVDHDDLVEQRDRVDQRLAHPGHDVTDGRGLVAGRHDEADHPAGPWPRAATPATSRPSGGCCGRTTHPSAMPRG